MASNRRRLKHIYLFPRPTFWTGIGSLMDVCGALNMYDISPAAAKMDYDPASAAKADYEALRSDWEAVGESMRWAISQHEKEISKNNR